MRKGIFLLKDLFTLGIINFYVHTRMRYRLHPFLRSCC
jgi:hypothetical protein